MKHSLPATFHLEPCAARWPCTSRGNPLKWGKRGTKQETAIICLQGPLESFWSACMIGHRGGDFSRSVSAPGCTNFRHSCSNGAGVPDLRSRPIDPQGKISITDSSSRSTQNGSDGRKLPDVLLNDGEVYDCQHCASDSCNECLA